MSCIPLKSMKIIILIITLFTCQIAQAQWFTRISWSPEEPGENDDIILIIDGEFAQLDGFEWVNQEIQRDGNRVTIDLMCRQLEFGRAEITPFQLRFPLGRLAAGEYIVTASIYTLFQGQDDFRMTHQRQVQFRVGDVDGIDSVTLTRGWNLISSNIDPNVRDIQALFSDLVVGETLLIVKDGFGRFYLPTHDFNNIPFWNFRKGYQVKLAEVDTLIISGEPVDPETPIRLHRGWNLIAYFPEQRLHARDAFANIENQLIIAKDGIGDFFMYDINLLELWLERGQGYQVKVREDVELVWAVR